MRIGHGDGHLLDAACINLFFDRAGAHLPVKALEVEQFKRSICEKLFDEHRLMDFHRCVLDVDYRKLLLNELAHN